jgi:hypothetical protein
MLSKLRSISFVLSVYSFFLYPDYGLLSDRVTLCSSRGGLYKETLHSSEVNFKFSKVPCIVFNKVCDLCRSKFEVAIILGALVPL